MNRLTGRLESATVDAEEEVTSSFTAPLPSPVAARGMPAAPAPAAAAPAAADPAVLAFESDLEGTFANMDAYADSVTTTASPSQALTRFSMAISTISTQQAVMRSFAEKHFEKEGSDALLFREVPKWIKYDRISGYRYRIVRAALSPSHSLPPLAPPRRQGRGFGGGGDAHGGGHAQPAAEAAAACAPGRRLSHSRRPASLAHAQVTSVQDPSDAFESFHDHVESIGFPGASGWADSIGDVAIHYLGRNWAVFSKVYPFAEQADARAAHSDVLLLGSTQHVMVTPMCAYRIGAEGLQQKTTAVDCLTCAAPRAHRPHKQRCACHPEGPDGSGLPPRVARPLSARPAARPSPARHRSRRPARIKSPGSNRPDQIARITSPGSHRSDRVG